jgi:hypothetical protein
MTAAFGSSTGLLKTNWTTKILSKSLKRTIEFWVSSTMPNQLRAALISPRLGSNT